jgi:coenzyme F420 biosynthesis associated uncharacterized protein
MASELVDWDLAAATAKRLAPPGPTMPLSEAADVVYELRETANLAEEHVAAYTGLRPVEGVRTTVAVVDRPEWSRSNAASLRLMISPLLARLEQRRPPGPVAAVGSRVTGVELGGGLAWLSTKVLGQYEVFLPPGQGDGRLTLVAPNVVEVERRLGVVPRDFRMWVCLHEQTHRSQFTAVPWMRPHLEGLLTRFLDATDLDAGALVERVRQAFSGLRSGAVSPLDLLRTPEQRVIVEEMQALMTLLEGHAEQVMDAVGPAVVPTVEVIRERFDERRGQGGPLDRVVRRVLGLDAKLEQYRQGGRFVRAVVERIGVAGFNEVWGSPERLPTGVELADPDTWIARVLREPAGP